MSSSGFLPGPRAIHRRRSSDWWEVAGQTCVAAYQPKGAASLAASYVNLANPGTYNAAPGTAPTLGAGGWVFDGLTQYLTTGIVQLGAAWTVALRFGDKSTTTDSALFGAVSSGTLRRAMQISLDAVTSNMIFYANGGTAYAEVAPRLNSGILCVAGKSAYRNGNLDATIGAGTDVPNLQLYVGAANVNGTVASRTAATIAAIAIYSTTLSAADVAALTARMAAL